MLGSDNYSHAGLRHSLSRWAQTSRRPNHEKWPKSGPESTVWYENRSRSMPRPLRSASDRSRGQKKVKKSGQAATCTYTCDPGNWGLPQNFLTFIQQGPTHSTLHSYWSTTHLHCPVLSLLLVEPKLVRVKKTCTTPPRQRLRSGFSLYYYPQLLQQEGLRTLSDPL